jgi:aspartyl-tRNA synthetase
MPLEAAPGQLESDPGQVRARAYDLVLNGWELGSGSVRIHRRELQQRVFESLGIAAEEAQEKFGFFLEAFEFGAPPHAGIALGLERLLALLLGKRNIRDLVAFPKTTSASCLMTGAPTEVTDQTLVELSLERRREPER